MMGDSTDVELKMKKLLDLLLALKLSRRVNAGGVKFVEAEIVKLKSELREWINNDETI